MTVYVDDMFLWPISKKWKYGESCHMTADTVEELKKFAVSIGLKEKWYQPKSMPHFDLTSNKRALAVKNGALELGIREFVKKARELEIRTKIPIHTSRWREPWVRIKIPNRWMM